MSVEVYLNLIRRLLPVEGSMSVSELELKVARAHGQPIESELFEQALQLEVTAEIYREGRVKFTEPDLSEAELMARLHFFLKSDAAMLALKSRQDSTVLEDTAATGARNTGEYSRPDFVMATIRKFNYDPHRYLDVITFELKNRAGANLRGVHETLAHTRFANYSFYVFPRSRIRPQETESLINACSNYGLGSITFTIGQNHNVSHFRFERFPVRQNADPYTVETFLEDRLSEAGRTRLRELAS